MHVGPKDIYKAWMVQLLSVIIVMILSAIKCYLLLHKLCRKVGVDGTHNYQVS
jgi:cytochrome c oxidase assembly protein Cox11